jgi:hypothetical protein
MEWKSANWFLKYLTAVDLPAVKLMSKESVNLVFREIANMKHLIFG